MSHTPPPDAVIARYLIETRHDPAHAAAVMAGEQSAGTFVRVPGETDALRAHHGARVLAVDPLPPPHDPIAPGRVGAPSLPGSRPPRSDPGAPLQRAVVTVAFPLGNIGVNLPSLWTTVAGNLFELSVFSGLRLLDLTLPPAYAQAFPGPAFGVNGTRALAGVPTSPLLGTIIKPSVGLTPGDIAALVAALCAARLDFIKDDELQADAPYAPLEARVRAVMPVVDAHSDNTGQRVMVAFNITGDIDHMRRAHDTVLAHGGTCVMINLLAVGWAGLLALRAHSQLPIHGHRAGWGMLSRHPLLGMDYAAFQLFARLAGADHLHVNGLANKFCEDDASVIASARACLTPLPGLPAPGYTALPVFSSGQTVHQVPATYAALGHTDLLYLAGGGIMAHPHGPAAGVRALRQAWDAALAGHDLPSYAATHPELAAALGAFDGARA